MSETPRPRTLSGIGVYCSGEERRIAPLNTFEVTRNRTLSLLAIALGDDASGRLDEINKTIALCSKAVASLGEQKTDNIYRTLLLTTLPYYLSEKARDTVLSSPDYSSSYAGDARLVIQGMMGDETARERMHMTSAAFGILSCVAAQKAIESRTFDPAITGNAIRVLSRMEQQTKAAVKGLMPNAVKVIPAIKLELFEVNKMARTLNSPSLPIYGSEGDAPEKKRHAGETLFINDLYLSGLKDHTNTQDTLQTVKNVLRILTIPDEEGTLEFPLLSPHEMTVQSGASLAYLSLTDHALTQSEETLMTENIKKHGGALITLSGNDEALNARVLSLMIDDMGFQHAHTVFADHLKKPNAPSPSIT